MDPTSDLLTATRSAAAAAPPSSAERAYLLVLEGGSSRMFHLPRRGTVLIGRTPEAELVLSDNSVSRRHARITLAEGEISVSDLESFNGTRVNGELIKDKGARELSSGDVVAIGDVVLVLHCTSQKAEPKTLLAPAALRRRVAEEIERAQGTERSFTVLALQLAEGKPGSEPRLGRDGIEKRVQARLRLIDAASWFGERELLILLPEQGAAPVRRFALELLEQVGPPGPGAPGAPDESRARAGLASYPAAGVDVETLLGAARSAATSAKAGAVLDAADAAVRLQMGERTIFIADPAMLGLFELLKRLARSDIPVLVRGETGAGKENAAYAVHHFSARSGKPFVAVNCAAIAETLIESELFGYERGAFSGATHAKPGLLEAASGGTVFLDEVGELSPSAQSKLLRALETKRITRVGDVREREVDIRIVAATNRDLEAEVTRDGEKRFRPDLFFRLSAATVILPPLRERPREVTLLGDAFLKAACERIGRPPLLLTPGALRALGAYRWPGNVRELRNTMEYLAAALVDPAVEVHHLPAAIASAVAPPAAASRPAPRPPESGGEGGDAASAPSPSKPPAPAPAAADDAARAFRPIAEEIRELEKRRMEEALGASRGVRKVAAELISMPLRTFTMKLKQYGLGGERETGDVDGGPAATE
ncbi:MAG: sigma 54-interacting transcriptional regulator [Polyangia bacterium]